MKDKTGLPIAVTTALTYLADNFGYDADVLINEAMGYTEDVPTMEELREDIIQNIQTQESSNVWLLCMMDVIHAEEIRKNAADFFLRKTKENGERFRYTDQFIGWNEAKKDFLEIKPLVEAFGFPIDEKSLQGAYEERLKAHLIDCFDRVQFNREQRGEFCPEIITPDVLAEIISNEARDFLSNPDYMKEKIQESIETGIPNDVSIGIYLIEKKYVSKEIIPEIQKNWEEHNLDFVLELESDHILTFESDERYISALTRFMDTDDFIMNIEVKNDEIEEGLDFEYDAPCR